MSIYNIKSQFASKREFHKEKAQLPYEEKVMQVIELQKIDLEFSKNRRGRKSTHKLVWVLGKL
jgi:hypothetical protein